MMHPLRNKWLDYHYFNIYVAWERGNVAEAELPDMVHGDRGTAAGERQPGHRGRRAPRPGAVWELRCAATDSRRLFFLYSDQKSEIAKDLGDKTD